MPENDLDTQFQIGDDVVYVPEGIRCKVIGYVWRENIGLLPKVAAYTLSCGISVPREAICKARERRRFCLSGEGVTLDRGVSE